VVTTCTGTETELSGTFFGFIKELLTALHNTLLLLPTVCSVSDCKLSVVTLLTVQSCGYEGCILCRIYRLAGV